MFENKNFDLIVIGAGGAGIFCAINVARNKKRVLVIDHSEKIGTKILISGGGRCNFTNIFANAENYVSKNKHFCKSALAKFTPKNFIEIVESHKIPYHEKKLGQLFCTRSASDILQMLLCEAKNAGVEFLFPCSIKSIANINSQFILETNSGSFQAQNLVVATGGLSIPKIGATGFGYEIARQFGIGVEATSPALVGFDFADLDQKTFSNLAGVSFDSVVTCNKKNFSENVLFTHTGFSGPAILQASLYWHTGEAISINALPNRDLGDYLISEKKQGTNKEVKNILTEFFPKSLAEKICEINSSLDKLQHVSDQRLLDLAHSITNWKFYPQRNFGYQKAEVTRGGVSTNELSSKTMEAKKVSGLYFIGEVVDVTGQLGGYNFQWAWSSAFAAAENISK